jgi:arylsulfatase A-like enzyme
MDRTFSQEDDEISNIGYITGNPYSRDHILNSRFEFVDEVWKKSWDKDAGTIRARPITDRAITASRENKANRLIVHYMQPHFPSVPERITDGVSRSCWGEERMSVWGDIAEGKVTVAEAWDAYVANLEYVLNDVQLLLSNIDADNVVITADHGEGFGEQGMFGHGESPFPVLRRVPWIETFAEDMESYRPETSDETEISISVKDRLKQLGYR